MSNLWYKWKNKIKNLFTYETEEIIEEEIQLVNENLQKKAMSAQVNESVKEQVPRYNHSPESADGAIRMMYQYPENSPYRPAPDPRLKELPQRQERRPEPKLAAPKSEEPVYEVTVRRDRGERRRAQFTQGRTSDYTPAFEDPIVNDAPREKVEVGKRPFQRTEVPSPIYGFHPREDGDGLPAFMHPENSRSGQFENEEESMPELSEFMDFQGEEERPEQISMEEMEPVQHTFSKLPVINEQYEEKELSDPFVQEEAETPPSLKQEEMPPGEKRVRRERREPVQQQTAPNQEKTPFNVIMTDTDKLHMAHKEYQREQEVKQRFKQIVSKSNEVQRNAGAGMLSIAKTREPLPLHLLDDPEPADHDDSIWVHEQAELLEETLAHFNVNAKVVKSTQGPSVTKFEVQPEQGVKVSKVKNLSDDLKLNLAAKDIRIEAPIPGKKMIGIEVPNPNAQTVGLQEIFESDAFQNSDSPLTVGLGLSIEGTPIVTNINKMPHGLIAGATGSGKSVCINTILISLLYKASHEDVRLMLIDPKMVELAPYNGIPHLVSPVITDVKAATAALKWAVAEMEDRYDRFVKEGVRDIARYNDKVLKQGRTADKMPFLVIVIDELADLMMVSPQDVEDSICRIAQKARACGIHLLLATQRPSVDVITGLIKANIPTRIAFSVSSQVDSRTIIDTNGAERLLGKGDMLFLENGTSSALRIQGAFVSDDEIDRVADYARSEAPVNYLFEQEELLAKVQVDEEVDELLEAAIDFVIEHNTASTSLLQRQFRIGYNRAARLIDTLEQRGIINQQNGSKPRDVLVSKAQLEEMTK